MAERLRLRDDVMKQLRPKRLRGNLNRLKQGGGAHYLEAS